MLEIWIDTQHQLWVQVSNHGIVTKRKKYNLSFFALLDVIKSLFNY